MVFSNPIITRHQRNLPHPQSPSLPAGSSSTRSGRMPCRATRPAIASVISAECRRRGQAWILHPVMYRLYSISSRQFSRSLCVQLHRRANSSEPDFAQWTASRPVPWRGSVYTSSPQAAARAPAASLSCVGVLTLSGMNAVAYRLDVLSMSPLAVKRRPLRC